MNTKKCTCNHIDFSVPCYKNIIKEKSILCKNIVLSIPIEIHEIAMKQAILMATQNKVYPFGAVITDINTNNVIASGVNNSSINPIFHGEIVCINDYIKKNGNKNWNNSILYTTGEPCPMCMSALIWAGIAGVVYGSSIETIKKYGIDTFNLTTCEVIKNNNFTNVDLLGGVLETECNNLFKNRLEV